MKSLFICEEFERQKWILMLEYIGRLSRAAINHVAETQPFGLYWYATGSTRLLARVQATAPMPQRAFLTTRSRALLFLSLLFILFTHLPFLFYAFIYIYFFYSSFLFQINNKIIDHGYFILCTITTGRKKKSIKSFKIQ